MTSPFVSHGDELHLSNRGQLELLRGMVARGAPLRMVARGHSMAPFVRDGDVLTIAPLHGQDPEVGEVVAFTVSGTDRLAIHRVLDRTNTGWLMRGDNSGQTDGSVTADELLGRVVRVERSGHEVRVGNGPERVVLAVLNRCGLLWAAGSVVRRFRRRAAHALRRVQGLSVYRCIGRGLPLSIEVVPAARDDRLFVVRLRDFESHGALSADQGDLTEWVAKRGGKVVGFVQYMCRPDPDDAWAGHWLFGLTVRPWFRGLGVGEALTRRVMEHARLDNAPELLLTVFEDNHRAILLYRKLGFQRIAHPVLEPILAGDRAEGGRGRIIMQMSLGEASAP